MKKLVFYLLLFGILTFFSALFWEQPKREFSSAEVLGSQTGLGLFIQPMAGRRPLVDKINAAGKEILVEVYLLSDKEIIAALKEAQNRGVTVKVMLEEHPFGGGNLNATTLPSLIVAGINARWTNPTFALTHEKALVIDSEETCILNQNLTAAAFETNREYDLCDGNPAEVKEVENIFNADWNRTGFVPKAANLIVSPDNARGKITALIESAKISLDIEIEVLQDQKIVELLGEMAKKVAVRVVLPPVKSIEGSAGAIDELRNKGVKTRTLSSPYPHAKLIIVDQERAYIGSVNLSGQSMDQNRELGILVSQPDIINQLSQQFEADWEKAIE